MRYAKFFAQVAAAVAAAVLAATMGDEVVDASEWVNVILAAVLVIPVFYAPNDLRAPIAKAVVSAVSPVFVLLSSLLLDGGFSTTDTWQLVAAIAGAVLVYAVPNTAPVGGYNHQPTI